jgi:hypothetical protein
VSNLSAEERFGNAEEASVVALCLDAMRGGFFGKSVFM